MAMQWNPDLYAANASFVPALGHAALAMLAAGADDRILDLGCGDGVLTADIAATGASVLGIDSSEPMLAAARQRGLSVQHADAQHLPFADEFTAVFSNAALHWMPDQRAVADSVFRALRPGGRYVGECGGHMNIAAIRTALRAALEKHGFNPDVGGGQIYQTADDFRHICEAAGFVHVAPVLIPRITPLPAGIGNWLATFRGGLLDTAGVPAAMQDTIISEAEHLLRPILCDGQGNWSADYVRLRWRAEKPR